MSMSCRRAGCVYFTVAALATAVWLQTLGHGWACSARAREAARVAGGRDTTVPICSLLCHQGQMLPDKAGTRTPPGRYAAGMLLASPPIPWPPKGVPKRADVGPVSRVSPRSPGWRKDAPPPSRSVSSLPNVARCWRGNGPRPSRRGSALHVMLFLENLIQALLIFNGLRSSHCQRALLGYHYRRRAPHLETQVDLHALV